jgi:hypothetical protein
MNHRTVIAGFAAALMPTSAFAHAGHLGELAGHSHWVGAAALAGAALLAGVIALKDRKRKKDEDAADTQPDEADTSGEAAQ